MNREKLNSIYHNIALAEKSDIEQIFQLTVEYPYYSLPFEILAKHYYQSNHYKFEDMLRQAAMRVQDRKALYDYIHESQQVSDASESVVVQNTEQEKTASLAEFLGEEVQTEDVVQGDDTVELEPNQSVDLKEENVSTIEEETFSSDTEEVEEAKQSDLEITDEKPEEFVLDGHIEFDSLEDVEEESNDIIGEEIHTEFSFSKSFQVDDEEAIENVENQEELIEESEEVEETIEAIQEKGNEVLADLQDMVSEIQEESENNKEEEKSVEKSIKEDSPLRKYPIYNIESSYSVEQLEKKEEEKDSIASESTNEGPKDFFAWLNAPKPPVEKEEEKELEVEKRFEDEEESQESVKNVEESTKNSNVNLDLIERFISSNPQISRPKREFFNAENMAKRSEVPDLEFVTETLANIYYEQGNYDLAIKAYEKLILQNPSKETYFADLIKKLKKERK